LGRRPPSPIAEKAFHELSDGRIAREWPEWSEPGAHPLLVVPDGPDVYAPIGVLHALAERDELVVRKAGQDDELLGVQCGVQVVRQQLE